MELSTENLDEILDSEEYKQYQFLKRKFSEGKEVVWLGCLAFLLLNFVFYFVVASIVSIVVAIAYYPSKETLSIASQTYFFILYLGMLFFPISYIPVIIIYEVFKLEHTENKIYKFFSHKTYSYRRFIELNDKFSPLESKLQERRSVLWSAKRLKLSDLERDAKSVKRKFTTQQIVSEKRTTRSPQNPLGLKIELPQTKRENNPSETQIDAGNKQKFQEKSRNKDFIKKQSNEIEITVSPIVRQESNSQITGTNPATEKIEEILTKVPPRPITSTNKLENDNQKADIPSSNPHQTNLFDEIGGLEEITKVPITPIKKQNLTYEGVIKASRGFYRQLADKKMEIGEKGELLVMGFEKTRLKKEGNQTLLNKLEHSSKKIGDGLGYDILSFENQEKIYIEVKTTTGNFEDNLFFTERELLAMKNYGSQYYLYRIYNFDESTNTGKLVVFRGEDEIMSFFNFLPRTYKLEPKTIFKT